MSSEKSEEEARQDSNEERSLEEPSKPRSAFPQQEIKKQEIKSSMNPNSPDPSNQPQGGQQQQQSRPPSGQYGTPQQGAPQQGQPQYGGQPQQRPPQMGQGFGPPQNQGPPQQRPAFQGPPMQQGQGYQGPPPYQQQGPPPNFGPYQGPPPGGQGGFGGPPPNAPQPKKIKRSPLPMIIGLVILVVVGGTTLIALISGLVAGSGSSGGGGGMFSFGEKIAILEVDGVIGAGDMYASDTERLRALVAKWKSDDSIKGMVIRVNSPGGAVSATQDLYTEIQEFRAAGKPVYTSMGDIAASGGYYLAMASDEVWVNSGTLTGSIGVILSFYGYEEMFNKLGLESRAIKSGEFKDIGSGSRPMTDAEKELLDEMVVDVFEQFFEVVYDNRLEAARDSLALVRDEEQSLTEGTTDPATLTDAEVEEYLRTYCDGRIFSGRQALDYGMADKEGTLQETLDAMRLSLGLDDDSPVVTTPKPQPGLFGTFDQKLNQLQQYQPGSVHMEFRFTM